MPPNLQRSHLNALLHNPILFFVRNRCPAVRFIHGRDVVKQYVRKVRLISRDGAAAPGWSRYLAGTEHGEKFCADYAGLTMLDVDILTAMYKMDEGSSGGWLWNLVQDLDRNVRRVETVIVQPRRGWYTMVYSENLAKVMQEGVMDGREDKEVVVERVRRVWEVEVLNLGAVST